MTDALRDKRLSDAASLQKSLASLHKVPAADRQEFFHDRVMSVIDDVCVRHKGSKTTPSFTAAQILILKDVVFQAVFILDPLNKTQEGFWNKLRGEWRETSAIKQITYAFAAVGFLATASVGAYHFAQSAWKLGKSISFSLIDEPDGVPPIRKPPPVASTPSTGATAGH